MTRQSARRFVVATALLALAGATIADPATDKAFENLADEYVSDLSNFSPVAATPVGDHGADDRLDKVDAAARA